jgi:hypothetical protein
MGATVSRESDIYAILSADATLLATLTGGVYKRESTGIEGVNRTTTPTAFDSNGYLRPCALIAERATVPDGVVKDLMARVVSTRVTVEVYLYADSSAGYTPLDTAAARVYALLQGAVLANSFEVELVNVVGRWREMDGSLMNACATRYDWTVNGILS